MERGEGGRDQHGEKLCKRKMAPRGVKETVSRWKQEIRADGFQGKQEPLGHLQRSHLERRFTGKLQRETKPKEVLLGGQPLGKGHFRVQTPEGRCWHQKFRPTGNLKTKLTGESRATWEIGRCMKRARVISANRRDAICLLCFKSTHKGFGNEVTGPGLYLWTSYSWKKLNAHPSFSVPSAHWKHAQDETAPWRGSLASCPSKPLPRRSQAVVSFLVPWGIFFLIFCLGFSVVLSSWLVGITGVLRLIWG